MSNQLIYTEGYLNLGSPRPARRFFILKLRSIASAVVQTINEDGSNRKASAVLDRDTSSPVMVIFKYLNLGGLK
jgi:hypothetical protein